ncbi:putative sporulation protein YtaF [Hathewaya proteolytica DSM 3090]|uniref:Putative sporulation protein YtaF n=1 Tax=Hathewaya proteolytica DSM 3090 TaxID=1121331 RepID=A0A1M6R639_9CLOT|nr:sporulation membrane protein YtaF [Hathewaya proteolytica]SHK27896.1 putative sporulation protein YtaF [Hathewaya proteolytica DSM 3090]
MLETFLLVLALSLDALVASIAYSTNKIKIPLKSICLMSLISSVILGIALSLGGFIKEFIPPNITTILSFIILLLLGIYYLFEGLIKNYLRKQQDQNKKVHLNFCNICVVLDIYLDETKADFNHSKNLNLKEAAYLATALSIDSLAVGVASSMAVINYWQTLLMSFAFNLIFIMTGTFIGKKIVEKSNLNLSWLSGALLIILAVKNLF